MSTRPVIAWPPIGATAAEVVTDLDILHRALDGSGPAIATAGIIDPAQVPCIPADAAVVIGTSGTTGIPKPALLPASALRMGRTGVHDIGGGPGQWMLAVPPSHITGLCVILRSLHAGFRPIPLAPGRFDAEGFVTATRELDPRADRHYTTLVPTQLRRVMASAEGIAAAREYTRILVGAAPLPPADRETAEAHGIRVLEGYGLSETAGGCIYDGHPLPGAHLRLEAIPADDSPPEDEASGRIVLGGDMVALGYLDRPEHDRDFSTDHTGMRWFRTHDHGRIGPDGRLRVIGRLDDLINTGGLKVAPTVVEDALAQVGAPGVGEALAVGAPDPEWGETVALLVVPPAGEPLPAVADLRAALADLLPAHALPRVVVRVESIPTTGPGKPDRARARRWLASGALSS
ncbi:O-succinylbenzoic acid--CoA ligase [Austwickia chelonae]|uniref:O-succinylbenzoate--CoA ligase n=1 Tax=Austwickia chelonae NBRC 105200 TaxID=1184607 RepID=K6V6C4_9MICO|nr:AMP-binding protein [Austwickia chelonae]GAB77788.1 o-succinylbenzoate--CoA ligase [Austwickia chelonae NBRC 105200]SEV89519.1 O-succinylbenzoic acid--CoA ligase [Austwickia chelonae]